MSAFSGVGKLLKDFVVSTLTTTDKTIPGAINELKAAVDGLNTKIGVKDLSSNVSWISGAYNSSGNRDILVVKSGKNVYVNIYAPLAASGFEAWTVTALCAGLPVPATGYARSGLIGVDGVPGANMFFDVRPDGTLNVCSRDYATNGKNILGGFSYISAE